MVWKEGRCLNFELLKKEKGGEEDRIQGAGKRGSLLSLELSPCSGLKKKGKQK